MKKQNRTKVKFIAVLALMTIAFWSCKDEMNKVGYDLLLPGDLITARTINLGKGDISAYTFEDDYLRTSKPGYNLLGTLVDPVFGKTTADFACQLNLSSTRKYDKTDHLDSIVFILKYASYYGDHTVQKFQVYELKDDLNGSDNANYYQNIDLPGMAKSELLGEINVTPRLGFIKDTADTDVNTDTVALEISIPLSTALAERLMNLTDTAVALNSDSPNKAFIKLFKGIYIKAGDLNEGGAILRTAPFGVYMYTTKPKIKSTTGADSVVYKQVTTYFGINKNTALVNRFVHDYTQTSFYPYLKKETYLDKHIYLQTTGGLSSKIYIPALSKWNKDSAGYSINKAEMVLKVDWDYMDTVKFTPPYKLVLGLIGKNGELTDSTGNNLIYPADLNLSESYYGGIYNKADSTYRFNLASHVQQLIKGTVENYGFYLTTNNKNTIANRVVLNGAASETGIHLNITYSKIK